MRLELIFWYNKQDNEFHRRIIQGVKLDSAGRSSKRSDDFLKPIGRAMWNGDTEADAGAHRFLALFERRQNAVPIGSFDFVQPYEQISQLDDCRPTLSCLHVRYDLIGG